MQPLESIKGPFKNEAAVLNFIKKSSINGRKYQKIVNEIQQKKATLKISESGKKYKFEAGAVTLEVEKNAPKKFHLLDKIRKACSRSYKKKCDDKLKMTGKILFQAIPKTSISPDKHVDKEKENLSSSSSAKDDKKNIEQDKQPQEIPSIKTTKIELVVPLEKIHDYKSKASSLVNDVKARKEFLTKALMAATDKAGDADYKNEVGTAIAVFLNHLPVLEKDKQLSEGELNTLYHIGKQLSSNEKSIDSALKSIAVAIHKLPLNSPQRPKYDELVKILEPLANSGNQKAKFELGYVYSKNPVKEQAGIKLLKELATQGNSEAETHLRLEDLRRYEAPCSFTDAIFKPLPKPSDFKDALITKQELDDLLDKYPNIANTLGKETGGKQYTIRQIFHHKLDRGIFKLRTTNAPLNEEFKLQFRQLLTIIKNDKKEQEVLLNQLKNGFIDCEPGMQQCVSEMLAELRSFEHGFKAQVKIKVHEFKNQMLEELLLMKFPNAFESKNPKFQMTHLKSGYIASLGKDFGLNGVEESSCDKDKYTFSSKSELDQAKLDLKQKIHQNFNTFIKNYATELNNPLITSDKGVGEKITAWKNKYEKELDPNFLYYSEDKEEFYKGLGEPKEAQTNLEIPYVSHAELRKCLEVIKLAKRD